MRHSIKVKEKTETAQGGGVSTYSYITVATVRGRVEPVSDREYIYGQQHGHAVTHRVTVREPIALGSGTDFVPTAGNCQLEFDSRTLDVVSVRREAEKRRTWWVFTAKEKVD